MSGRARRRAQGTTEYLVLVGLIGLAGLGAVKLLASRPALSPLGAMGSALEHQVAAPLTARELEAASGQGPGVTEDPATAETRIRRRSGRKS
jgi:hypothetical protein